MTLHNNKINITTMLLMSVLIVMSSFLIQPISVVDATKTRACTTNQTPKGVDSVDPNEVWIANDGGTLQEFTNLSTDCTNTSYTVNGDPHFIDRSTTTQVQFTNHINNKITYFDPSTGNKIDCVDANIDGPDDIASETASAQYSTSYNNGKLIKTVKGTGACDTVTPFTLPLDGANPEGVDKSTDVGGLLVVDQFNNNLYIFDTSTNTFSLCASFSSRPWFVADDSTQHLAWVTFNEAQVIQGIATLSCGIVRTSALTTPTFDHLPFDIAVRSGGDKVIVSFNDESDVGIYDISADSWTFDDWNAECSGCTGFGIDAIYSTGDYYAAMRGTTTSKIVKGVF